MMIRCHDVMKDAIQNVMEGYEYSFIHYLIYFILFYV